MLTTSFFGSQPFRMVILVTSPMRCADYIGLILRVDDPSYMGWIGGQIT
ncbi:TPA: hypothetical protein OW273_001590 [Citrobacter freundii]|nr:hypothetical protein [Citrobacter freundii]